MLCLCDYCRNSGTRLIIEPWNGHTLDSAGVHLISYSPRGVVAPGFTGLIVRQSNLYRDAGCGTLITKWPAQHTLQLFIWPVLWPVCLLSCSGLGVSRVNVVLKSSAHVPEMIQLHMTLAQGWLDVVIGVTTPRGWQLADTVAAYRERLTVHERCMPTWYDFILWATCWEVKYQ